SKFKRNIKRDSLEKDDRLSDRIRDACNTITVEDCQGWIRHFESFWERCYQNFVL
ncbi:hypothetical protein K501DRAFT_186471, partial [Backusella circina FSU 941]